jgi:predicted transcriptional regulator
MELQTNGRNIAPSGQVLMDFFEKLGTNEEIFLYHVKRVSDLMKVALPPINLESKMKEIWAQMNSIGVNDLPVVDVSGSNRKGTLKYTYVGIVRKRDLAAMASRFVGGLAQYDSDDQMMQVRLSSYDTIDRSTPVITPDMPVFTAIGVMLENKVESIAVVGPDKEYLACISTLDILACLSYLAKLQKMRTVQNIQEVRLVDLFNNASSVMPSDKMLETFMGTARDVMDDAFVPIVSSDSIGDAINLMERTKRDLLIVVDEEGNLKGVTNATEIQLALPPIVRKSGRTALVGATGIFKTDDADNAAARQVRAERILAVTHTGFERATMEMPVTRLIKALLKPSAITIPVLDAGNVIKGVVGRWELVKAFLALGGVLKKRGIL